MGTTEYAGDQGVSTDVEAAKSRLARGYSRAAPLYDALAGHMYVTGIRRLLPLLRVPPMASILDIGCGTGVNTFEAARWFAPTSHLCGIDISPGMVEVARSKAMALGVPAEFTVGDAESLPYPDHAFDVILCNSVFHWFKDRDRALREMWRVLRPGGQVALLCAATPGFREWFGLIDHLMKQLRGPDEPSAIPDLPTAQEVIGRMLAAGFHIEHAQNPAHMQYVRAPESFVRVMATVAPGWAADLTDAEQSTLESMAAAAIRSALPRGFATSWAAVEVVGRKG